MLLRTANSSNPLSNLLPFHRYISRLYIFPLRVIYPCACYLIQEHLNVPFHLFLNTMMYMLLIMNIYWFSVSDAYSNVLAISSSFCIIFCLTVRLTFE